MTIRSKRTLPGRWPAALALAAGLIVVGAGPAGAQWFRWPSWDSALAPAEVEHMIEASGYRLTGPVLRNGPIYLANVLGREDDPSETGRVVPGETVPREQCQAEQIFRRRKPRNRPPHDLPRLRRDGANRGQPANPA